MIKINEKFKKLIPPPTQEEYNMLENSLLEEGCRDPLVLWGETLIDGHNRYEICTKHSIPFATVNKDFDRADEAKIWIIQNQIGRRNLSKSQLAVLALDYEKILSRKAEERMLSGIDQDVYGPDFDYPGTLVSQGIEYPEKQYTDKFVYTNKERDRFTDGYIKQKIAQEKETDKNTPIVYFIQAEEGGDIKIGCSVDVKARLKQLQTSHPEKLRVTNIILGGYEKEKELHKQFENIKKEGEWFKATHKLCEIAKAIPYRTLKSSEQAGKIVGVSGSMVRMLKYIEKEKPEYLPEILKGDLVVKKVYRDIKESKREDERNENKNKVNQLENSNIDISVSSIVKNNIKFSTVVIDPPWDWSDEGDINQLGRAKPNYSTMSIEQIMQIPIDKITDKDCHLYLWITNRSLPKGFALLDAWGFRYITCLTWCKPSIGMGNYFRGSSEQVLFGVKGSLSLLRKDIGTWFSAPRGKMHSQKPTEFYDLIKTCSPAPRIDIFGRMERDGYTILGENNVIL